MKILFINGSPNQSGNTSHLAQTLLKDHEYETLNLVAQSLWFCTEFVRSFLWAGKR